MDRIRRRSCILCGVGVGGLLPERIKAVVEMMNKFQRKIGKAVYKPNCYILVSATQKKDDDISWYRVEPAMTFLYDAGEWAAEWEPRYGPIQTWHKCDADAEGAKPHYFYDFEDTEALSFSQLAVERERLPQAFVRGDYDYIFSVLEGWARR